MTPRLTDKERAALEAAQHDLSVVVVDPAEHLGCPYQPRCSCGWTGGAVGHAGAAWGSAGDHEDEHPFGLEEAFRAGRAFASQEVEVTDAMVERGAEAAFFQDDLGGHIKGRWTFATIPEEGRQNYRVMVRAALEVALSGSEEPS